MLTKEIVDEFFDYKDGVLYWKKKPKEIENQVKIGDIAGHNQKDGYCRIGLHGKHYGAHRLIFLLHHSFMPKVIDHIDGNPNNNKIENLREATRIQNGHNRKLNKNTTSGIKNVSFYKPTNKWVVHLQVNKKLKNFGYYKDLELAELVAIEARDKYHGEFARHF